MSAGNIGFFLLSFFSLSPPPGPFAFYFPPFFPGFPFAFSASGQSCKVLPPLQFSVIEKCFISPENGMKPECIKEKNKCKMLCFQRFSFLFVEAFKSLHFLLSCVSAVYMRKEKGFYMAWEMRGRNPRRGYGGWGRGREIHTYIRMWKTSPPYTTAFRIEFPLRQWRERNSDGGKGGGPSSLGAEVGRDNIRP